MLVYLYQMYVIITTVCQVMVYNFGDPSIRYARSRAAA